MKGAIAYLNSIYSTPSVIDDTSFHRPQMQSSLDQSGIHADSILGTFSPHSSFMEPNETSILVPAQKRRKSIRDSEYASLLVSEGKPVSSYSSLLRDSISTAQDVEHGNYTSLFAKSVQVSDSSTLNASISPTNSSLSGSVNALSSKVSLINKSLTERVMNKEEKEETKKDLEPEEEPEPELETQPKQEQEEPESEQGEEGSEQGQELNPESEQEQTEDQAEDQAEEQTEQEDLPEIDQGGLSDHELPESINSIEETTIRDLFGNSHNDEKISIIDTLMPPPSSSLRLRIPEKGISRRGRKKGSKSGYFMNS